MPLTHEEFAGLTHLGSGKVRELFAVGDDAVLLVASDRISAFDVVLPTEIPDKGAVLTGLSLWWFDQLADLVPSHVVSSNVDEYPAELTPYTEQLRGRSMLCRRLNMVQIECVARGYLTGSGLKDYQRTGAVSGHPLPTGLVDGSKLPAPIYTPSTKAPIGEHDENISRADAAGRIGTELAAELERLTLQIFGRASVLAAERGILLADTKFEFGHDTQGTLRLADEVLTPDSSRFWPEDTWRPGASQPSFDKQYIRDYLTSTGWDRTAPGPELPADVVEATRVRYVEAYERLTGISFKDYLSTV
ncbi:phosphoribosylaminoimidazole-succinocarboxamide synthase [Frankia casuarinae]|jgi:phosphoribosylaminoimidazole-succinocarboxamide synthase|uniref:Phosphoribosylaminoimidazole-succinocarboxamide synthase n=1 Tax=Frankia casuarinae (strain DSM 45818 / CECT 9043 / HFP020203 / CcI3) TaxID=106370 RepID=Q2J4S3_FRACC|nr:MULTISPECIES: phosphoribosylaminoimidazolesuccinocarboxamide synthase [Frankia]ABD13719.1 phosphoribosylaminoimidazole-succinocarboxamide synthase [Frankia casuarinae]ETA02695.1 phosphoribosylaminoimidazole-succinocarboxamide synthase [Frankia sp. CcI6]EYT93081.1 phosphoribosylaminoimidazole-succinocarboxamide synthase [Frankia casuarinae]KFB07037.1 phosphoribosylaminoimidazole-succinocarboxamide synthase [Frankia sp. Allo2]OHV49557.1 phosphoribosylaminoimidazolesuccinocarboxamide synthase 